VIELRQWPWAWKGWKGGARALSSAIQYTCNPASLLLLLLRAPPLDSKAADAPRPEPAIRPAGPFLPLFPWPGPIDASIRL
jgi:hypothetical protein